MSAPRLVRSPAVYNHHIVFILIQHQIPSVSSNFFGSASDSHSGLFILQTAAGGGLQCNPLSVTAFTTLLAAAGPCEQQDAADSMIDLAHQLNNNADMIRFAQLFAQQPRNSPTSQSVPYCQTAPRNSELNGLFQCQFEGVNPKVFVGGTAVGGQGTIPFGRSTPLSPAGSCPAHTSGGIADGSQLTDITSDPGIG